MKCSIIITTHERPRALELVQRALLRQSAGIEEVIFADDGSGSPTREVIAEFDRTTEFHVSHMWHPREGVQKAAIVNSAIAVARGDVLVFLDGDCVPDRRWLSDHLREADGRTVWQGRRVQLGSAVSDALSPDGVSHGELDGWLSPKCLGQLIRRERRNFHLAIRIPRPIVRLFEKRKGLMGCNFSAPRAVVEAINGYDASWEGAGHLCEDLDLEIRLRQQGTPLTPLLHAANVFHLNHYRPTPAHVTQLRKERWLVKSPIAIDGIREAAERIRQGTTRNLLVD
jgi:glycosyltransferase involved in cell wall biosynthesis